MICPTKITPGSHTSEFSFCSNRFLGNLINIFSHWNWALFVRGNKNKPLQSLVTSLRFAISRADKVPTFSLTLFFPMQNPPFTGSIALLSKLSRVEHNIFICLLGWLASIARSKEWWQTTIAFSWHACPPSACTCRGNKLFFLQLVKAEQKQRLLRWVALHRLLLVETVSRRKTISFFVFLSS